MVRYLAGTTAPRSQWHLNPIHVYRCILVSTLSPRQRVTDRRSRARNGGTQPGLRTRSPDRRRKKDRADSSLYEYEYEYRR
eukprot:scaffold295326_cov33-Prasinocladus_malaysianus.AAC.2